MALEVYQEHVVLHDFYKEDYMRTYYANDAWDMGFSDIIEETPIVEPDKLTAFFGIIEEDEIHLYMKSPVPSWFIALQ